ncbi:MAG TPA: hypothetical protein VN863_03655, partial [Candidatus Dormibacteraeota bacterium]|nr:hypothetical protein [Candidatus Dormibacteraeota bacterium]
MGLLERVQKKSGEEGDRPTTGRLNAAAPPSEAPASPTELNRSAPTAPTTPGRPPLAPTRTDGGRSQGSTPAGRAAAAQVKPTAAQAQFARTKSRVHARLVEEMQDEDNAEREDIVAKIGELVNEVLAVS